jgi:hypothetical protein
MSPQADRPVRGLALDADTDDERETRLLPRVPPQPAPPDPMAPPSIAANVALPAGSPGGRTTWPWVLLALLAAVFLGGGATAAALLYLTNGNAAPAPPGVVVAPRPAVEGPEPEAAGPADALPDLVIDDVWVERDGQVAARVKNVGRGPIPEAVWTDRHPASSSVYLRVLDGKWGGGKTVPGFDPEKSLRAPGGSAVCPLRLQITRPTRVLVSIDHTRQVEEADEDNNTRTELLLPPGAKAAEPAGAAPVNLLAPAQGQVLNNRHPDSGMIVWDFRWAEVLGAKRYHLVVVGRNATNPLINDETLVQSHYRHAGRGYITNKHLHGWRWKVRALVDSGWTDWSEERTFDVAPLEAPHPPPKAQADQPRGSELADVRVTITQVAGGPFAPGNPVVIAYQVHNPTDKGIEVPLDGGRRVLGHYQWWVEYLDMDGTIPAIPARVARRGGKYAQGGSVVPHGPVLAAGERVRLQKTFDTTGFAPGRYRYTVEWHAGRPGKLVDCKEAIVEIK